MQHITNRQVKLMELMSRQTTYLPSKYFAQKLNVSERTVFNDIKRLENVLEEFQVEIKRKTNKGIKLSGDSISFGMFYQQLLRNSEDNNVITYQSIDRQIYIVRWLFIENKILTYQYLSLNLFVSTTSIVKDLEHIKSFMDEEVSLISDVKGTRVIGTENGIQRTLKRFTYYIIEQKGHNYSISSYGSQLNQLISPDVISYVKNAVEELKTVIESEVSEQYLKSIFIFLLILTERSRAGHYIEDSTKMEWDENSILENIPLAAQVCHTISNPLNFQFTFSEIHIVSKQLYAHRFRVKVNNRLIENLFKKDIESIIGKVSETMGIDVTTDEKLYDSLIYHMFLMVYRLKSSIIVQNPLTNEVKNHYRTLFQMIWYNMECFEKKYKVKVTDDEIAFITIHFQVAFERKEKKQEILVVCQTGIITSELIINRIKTLLPANIQFKLIAKSQLTQKIINNADFIISSVKLQTVTCPIVYVSPMINDNDLLNVYKTYLKSTKKIKRIAIQQETVEFENFFDEKYVYITNEVYQKDEAINLMIDQLECDGIVTDNFRTSVFEREKLGNTQVHYWIATPHGYGSEVNESKISIMLAKKSVRWNQDSHIQLILLLAIAEEDITNGRILLGNFFRNIIRLEDIEKDVRTFTQLNEFLQLFHDK